MIHKYGCIVGKKTINKIIKESMPLKDKHIVHINSTYYGGGVAEMLTSLVPLMNDIGIRTGWRTIKGNPDFFQVTKKFHNALQGSELNLSMMKKKVYEETNRLNSIYTHVSHHDLVLVHDPQPLPLIDCYLKRQPWLWRCHIDISKPNHKLWKYLKDYIEKYDHCIISKDEFMQDLKIPQRVICPSIDPLTPKNMDISDNKIKKYLKRFGIKVDKPIISQISRFDKWKDPLGVIEAFDLIRKKVDCKLVLLGSMATDDPEGQAIYEQVMDKVKGREDIIIINYENNVLVNALQRASAVVLQKSLKEGFGLTVTEAMWKSRPVVASDVGGISLQIKDGYNGYLVDSIASCAEKVVYVLRHPKKAETIGKRAKETVRKNFLITRHLLDYIDILKKMLITYRI